MALTKAKISFLEGLDGSVLTGAMPALDGSSLTGILGMTKVTSDPALNTNPSSGVGTTWVNKSSGEMFVCTDATAGENVWKNIGAGSGDVWRYQGTVAGVAAGGSNGATNRIESFPFASAAGGTDLGDLTMLYNYTGGFSSNSHGYVAGSDSATGQGSGGFSSHINKFAFASSANATVHAQLDYRTGYNTGGINSATDGYVAGGYNRGIDGSNPVSYTHLTLPTTPYV